jgi:DNA-binding XRE family transcriptional regulator
MKSHHLKILFVGRSSAVSRELTRLLQGAGYILTTERAATRRAGSAKLGQSRQQFRAVIQKGDQKGDGVGGRGGPRVDKPRATNLRGLRESVGKTQEEIARRIAISQSQLSRVEGRRDHLLSTLRRYVQGLGGEIEVCAVFDGTRVVLRDV